MSHCLYSPQVDTAAVDLNQRRHVTSQSCRIHYTLTYRRLAVFGRFELALICPAWVITIYMLTLQDKRNHRAISDK